jgi:hypothetical protein
VVKENNTKSKTGRINKKEKKTREIIGCADHILAGAPTVPAGVCKGAAGPRAGRLAQAAELKANVFQSYKASHRIVYMCTVFAYWHKYFAYHISDNSQNQRNNSERFAKSKK